MEFATDKLKDNCALAGVFGVEEASKLVYLSLFAQQHRGQEGSGIAAFNGRNIVFEKGLGLVNDIFKNHILDRLKGNIAIGHNRYSTKGETHLKNVQPIVADINLGTIAFAHNGNLVNEQTLKAELVNDGAIFTTTSDSEILIHLIAKYGSDNNIIDALIKSLKLLKGAYCFIMMTEDKLIGVRDPYGFRPLALGKLKNGFVLASESVAFDLIDGKFLREIEPGELVIIDKTGIKSLYPFDSSLKSKSSSCIFEYIYFARPDSFVFDNYVYNMRKLFGEKLAREKPVYADIVVPVPDSGLIAALGYATEAKIPVEMGIIRNHYVGRTFIEPTNSIRHFGVKLKLNPIKSIIKDKSIVVIDDSIVRGTTCRKIVKMLKAAGAKEIHMRISSPPILYPCLYGIDTPNRKELIASTHSIDEIKKYIGVDSLEYLSIDGLFSCVDASKFCDACFTGNYPVL